MGISTQTKVKTNLGGAMKFNHYIFDFDGTLADSEHTTMLLWEKLLHEYGMNIEISALRNDDILNL